MPAANSQSEITLAEAALTRVDRLMRLEMLARLSSSGFELRHLLGQYGEDVCLL